MKEQIVSLINKGMNRDLSVSKTGKSNAYENINIRIEARDNDTLLSVTNEKGNYAPTSNSFANSFLGELVGWNTLNEYLILFTHSASTGYDYIYRVMYDGSDLTQTTIFTGYIGLSTEHPIESITYFENENIQKIYWIDGNHPLRFMNFMNVLDGTQGSSEFEYTGFDSSVATNLNNIQATIEKDNAGSARQNGVVQYFLTLYNRNGQESGIVWISSLVYLSPEGRGGSPEEQNHNRVKITLSGIATSSFTNFRLYSIFRSSLDGEQVAYIVRDGELPEASLTKVMVIDDSANQTLVDASSILYKGSVSIYPGTIEHKDQTLFLGNLTSVMPDDTLLRAAIFDTMFCDASGQQATYSDGITWQADSIHFFLTPGMYSIPVADNDGLYPYSSQLSLQSNAVRSFKGGEKYRFALVFFTATGEASPAYWIGDKVNTLYPTTESLYGYGERIRRVYAQCALPASVNTAAKACGYKYAQLLIAKASYSDRSILAQGVINPTMFNVWERYNNGIYAIPSWMSRPRWAPFACEHFQSVANSDTPQGEIACNHWTTDLPPVPYYHIVDGNYAEEYEGVVSGSYIIVCYSVEATGWYWSYAGSVTIIVAQTGPLSDLEYLRTFDFTNAGDWPNNTYTNAEKFITLTRYYSGRKTGKGYKTNSKKDLFSKLNKYVMDIVGDSRLTVKLSTFSDWCGYAKQHRDTTYHFNKQYPNTALGTTGSVVVTPNAFLNEPDMVAGRWYKTGAESSDVDYTPAYYTKQFMFVDENTVTLESPELTENVINIDEMKDLKLRIIGVTWQDKLIADYTVEASHGKLSGENLMTKGFSINDIQQEDDTSSDGILSWPLWTEYGLKENNREHPEDEQDWTPADYDWSENVVTYWLHMWGKPGLITGYTDSTGAKYSELTRKVFANLRYFGKTEYHYADRLEYDLDSVRLAVDTLSSGTTIQVGDETKLYTGYVDVALSVPEKNKYPISFCYPAEVSTKTPSSTAFLFSDELVPMTYISGTHAIITLPTIIDSINHLYKQRLLPYIQWSVVEDQEEYNVYHGAWSDYTGLLGAPYLPWVKGEVGEYRNKYAGLQDGFTVDLDSPIVDGTIQPYSFIGELYHDYDADPSTDTRYGGNKLADANKNTYIPVGDRTYINPIEAGAYIYGYDGDTFIQRWDNLRSKPLGGNAVNNIYDIQSVVLESHINLDGRFDKQRGNEFIASTDETTFGQINPVYSQSNNIFQYSPIRNTDAATDSYKTAITWTGEKKDLSDIDAWTHITLGSSLLLDGDKGSCTAIRRFGDKLLAFQDRSISEILFNSRTQIATVEGVPIEIANSGKVDGKRYISNKYGCVNKWSIVEGKSALYFVDNINKAFCSITRGANGTLAINDISMQLGFGSWFNKNNVIGTWSPSSWSTKPLSMVSFYDKVNNDIYLVRNSSAQSCLVFNENLGTFTSFFDYKGVPMMTNLGDRFISFKNNQLWWQNEGRYCNFFGVQKDFSVEYRVAPEPVTDKIWTNIEYRADFFRDSSLTEEPMDAGEAKYIENETFDSLSVWDEYQTTGIFSAPASTKRFRIWRSQIPRATAGQTNNVHGLDRIRNPWIALKMEKKLSQQLLNDVTANQNLMQLHDVIVKYFE